MTPPPVSFSEKAQATAKGGGYPVQISARDLDENFIFATLDVPERDDAGNQQPWIVTQITGPSGTRQRQIVFNPAPPATGVFSVDNGTLTWLQPPASGTHVLGAVDGALAWIPTEEC